MFRKIKRIASNLLHPVIGEVWMLHRVTNVPSEMESHRPYEMTPERLEILIERYIEEGYTFVTMAEVRKVMMREKKISNKFVAVTLDDGFEDNYWVALPIFRKYNIPFCIYIMQLGVVGKRNPHFPQFLYESQIVELDKEPLCTIGGHTYSHPRLAELNFEEQFREIKTCQMWLENLLGHPIVDFSYPFGSYNEDTIEILKEFGIQQSPLASGGEVLFKKNAPLLIPRVFVSELSVQK